MYKTGDVVKFLPDGNVCYIGRRDFQVKINGYRIELGEIENVIFTLDGIASVLVLAIDHNSTLKLGAFVEVLSSSGLDAGAITAHCKAKLPDYMVPKATVIVEKFPLNINGKIDRAKFIAMYPDIFEKGAVVRVGEVVQAGSEHEKKLCSILADLLQIDVSTISMSDDVFDLGVSSLQVLFGVTGWVEGDGGCSGWWVERVGSVW